MADEREGRSKASDIACRDPIIPPSWLAFAAVSGGGSVCPFVSAFSVDGVWGASPTCVWVSGAEGAGMGGNVCEAWTSHGSQPPGAWVIFAFSRPRRRGMEGPVRSMSRIPTEWPARESESASWVVMEDLPTPPLPERTYGGVSVVPVGWGENCGREKKRLTSTMCLTLSRDIPLAGCDLCV